jgi:hypothetical protein
MLCAVGGSHASAQTLRVPRGETEAAIIAAAEADGAAYPHPARDSSAAAPRRCVAGHDVGPEKSGEFTIGGMLGGPRGMVAGREGKVWWSPLYRAANMPPLVVRGRRLVAPMDTLWFTSDRIAWPVPGPHMQVPESERQYFFPSGITMPREGRWLVIATSGANWGCFILSVA